jgi:hypothetical protein
VATQWGSHSLGPGQSFGWSFTRGRSTGFLPYLSVIPTSPSFTPSQWQFTGGGYPYWNQLGISTQWSQLSNDGSSLIYYIVVQNNSNNTVSYAFVEADV